MAWSIVGDGSIGPPSAHIRSFQLSQSSRSACSDQGLALSPSLGRLRGEDVGHRARPAELLAQRLAVASGERRRVMFRGHGRSSPASAGDYSNEGQQPSSSWRPVRWVHVLSSRRWPTSFQIASGPYRRTASTFWISTVRPQRRQSTLSKC